MSKTASTFRAKSTIKAANLDHRRKINFNIGRYNAAVPNGKQQFFDLNLAREKAKNIKWKAIETLDRQLEKFEATISKRGAKVIWAETAEQAREEILKICQEKNCRILVKSKSMVTEEIHINEFLEEHQITSIETELRPGRRCDGLAIDRNCQSVSDTRDRKDDGVLVIAHGLA